MMIALLEAETRQGVHTTTMQARFNPLIRGATTTGSGTETPEPPPVARIAKGEETTVATITSLRRRTEIITVRRMMKGVVNAAMRRLVREEA
mmetsp:Transcript_16704/g.31681  ORF Transcript_16704/g.31681 Transcript_16704/m.31681 type:complete len:92 (+) Transcript_16704:1-276(+)